MSDLLSSPQVIANYDLLQKIGILDYTKRLKMKVNSTDNLLNEIIEIFEKQSNHELTDFVISRIVSKFVPTHLTFVFQPYEEDEHPEIICYEKTKPVSTDFSIQSLQPYKEFFKDYPNSIVFPLFEYKFPDAQCVEDLRKLNPEIIVPLLGMKGLYGIIIIGKKMVGDDYSTEEIIYLDRLMRFTSIWLQNNVHYKSSVMDSKTKLFNHSYFSKRLNDEIARFKRYSTPCTLLILDVDFFKKFNDVYGHLAGDAVLYSLARRLETSVREVDVVARFGGEEFVVLLLEHNQDAALMVAERVRKNIQDMEVHFQDQVLKITVSIGIAHLAKGINFPEDLVSRADAALYESKKNGRNRVTLYRSGLLAMARESHRKSG